jgi:nickel-dependent lactate racemase
MVKPGGQILVVAECAEGVGSAEFARRLKGLRDFEGFLEEIRTAPVEVDQWQLEKLALVGRKYELFFYTPGVRREDLGFLGDRWFGSIDEAVRAAIKGLPAGARMAIVPDGPYAFASAEQAVRA